MHYDNLEPTNRKGVYLLYFNEILFYYTLLNSNVYKY